MDLGMDNNPDTLEPETGRNVKKNWPNGKNWRERKLDTKPEEGKDKKPRLHIEMSEINKECYPKFMANVHKEKKALNQHYCLLHKHDLLAMEADIFGRPCQFCNDDLTGHYVLHCYICCYNICDNCHKKKHQLFIKEFDMDRQQDEKKPFLKNCPAWMQETDTQNTHSCKKHIHPLHILTPPTVDAIACCDICKNEIGTEAILRCWTCNVTQCQMCHDEATDDDFTRASFKNNTGSPDSEQKRARDEIAENSNNLAK